MNAEVRCPLGLELPQVVADPVEHAHRLAVGHLRHLVPADQRDPYGQGLAVLLVANPDQFAGFQRGVGEVDACCGPLR